MPAAFASICENKYYLLSYFVCVLVNTVWLCSFPHTTCHFVVVVLSVLIFELVVKPRSLFKFYGASLTALASIWCTKVFHRHNTTTLKRTKNATILEARANHLQRAPSRVLNCKMGTWVRWSGTSESSNSLVTSVDKLMWVNTRSWQINALHSLVTRNCLCINECNYQVPVNALIQCNYKIPGSLINASHHHVTMFRTFASISTFSSSASSDVIIL